MRHTALLILCLCSCGTETSNPPQTYDLEQGDVTTNQDLHLDGGLEADTTTLDAPLTDIRTPDTMKPDRSRPDSQVPDSISPDFALPDTSTDDLAQPDQQVPDTLPPDTIAPDTMTQSCTHPYVSASCTGGWCMIPAGCFKMSIANPVPCSTHPTREVRLTHSFVIGQKEVTTKEFDALVNYNPTTIPPSDQPVERIPWNMAAYYCNELSNTESRPQCYTCSSKWSCVPKGNPYTCKGYRLPTEAEWEYAYRAGTNTEFHNGPMTNCTADTKADAISWYKNTTLGLSHKSGCQKQANAWGLCDMAGNVAEMCHDSFLPTSGSTILIDPLGTSSTPGVRGGHFNSPAVGVTAFYRQTTTPTTNSLYYGFRCVRSL